jgi:O-antigen/teichoic acid export membrane protein
LLIVTEVAMGTFSGAFAVEVRRHGHASRNLIAFTCALLGTVCFVAIVGAQFFGDNVMALFGHEYRKPGGAILAILVLGLPASSLRSISSAANRLRRAGWRNFAQHGTYCAALLVGFTLVHIETGRSLAVCLVIARYVSAAVSLQNLNNLRSTRAGSTEAQVEPSAV